jgi:broad specificity phosphatase PhoE
MTRVDFLRHGETEAGGVLLGRMDAPLSAAGRTDVAHQLAGASWAVIVTSPLGRAKETAEIATEWSAQNFEIDAAWREMDFGDWDGRAKQELAADERFAAFYRSPEANPPPNGETADELRARVKAALERIAARSESPVLVVAHGGTIRMALAILLGLPLDRLWAIRIACATRVGVEMGIHPEHGLWGEILDIAQPPDGVKR